MSFGLIVIDNKLASSCPKIQITPPPQTSVLKGLIVIFKKTLIYKNGIKQLCTYIFHLPNFFGYLV